MDETRIDFRVYLPGWMRESANQQRMRLKFKRVPFDTTVGDIKRRIQYLFREHFQVNTSDIIFLHSSDNFLVNNNETLRGYDIRHGDEIFMEIQLPNPPPLAPVPENDVFEAIERLALEEQTMDAAR